MEQALVFRWFREKHELVAYITITEMSNKYVYYTNQPMWAGDIIKYDTYEQAELACIVKLIDIVKK